jgi:hypothetical protein
MLGMLGMNFVHYIIAKMNDLLNEKKLGKFDYNVKAILHYKYNTKNKLCLK